ncbi:ArnT family glycosyltransferase [Prolixibacter bellariivorans]|uniref:ArnT family glycosyltransferase n=1 Tax=Prolixibacter bellariivorans TaxID=314319 RepID=UPI000687DB9D|nr:glycosyltransferase family 39 protein [Prolixibacter bellariivorans]
MSRENRQLLALLVITFFAFMIHNGVLDANIMEARNLVTAREILQHHNWLVPTMNGVLRLEKPPLPTWIAAIMMQLFGQDSLAILRIPAALSAMLLVFFLFKLTKELTRDEHLPLLAGGTVATSFYIFFMARTITWDIFCHSFMLGAIWMLYRGWNRKEQAWKEFTWAGVLMGLSFLSKGPVSFFALLLPFLIAFFASYGFSGAKMQWKPLMVALGILLAFSTWWPLYIYFQHPEFSAYVAEKESAAWMNAVCIRGTTTGVSLCSQEYGHYPLRLPWLFRMHGKKSGSLVITSFWHFGFGPLSFCFLHFLKRKSAT